MHLNLSKESLGTDNVFRPGRFLRTASCVLGLLLAVNGTKASMLNQANSLKDSEMSLGLESRVDTPLKELLIFTHSQVMKVARGYIYDLDSLHSFFEKLPESEEELLGLALMDYEYLYKHSQEEIAILNVDMQASDLEPYKKQLERMMATVQRRLDYLENNKDLFLAERAKYYRLVEKAVLDVNTYKQALLGIFGSKITFDKILMDDGRYARSLRDGLLQEAEVSIVVEFDYPNGSSQPMDYVLSPVFNTRSQFMVMISAFSQNGTSPNLEGRSYDFLGGLEVVSWIGPVLVHNMIKESLDESDNLPVNFNRLYVDGYLLRPVGEIKEDWTRAEIEAFEKDHLTRLVSTLVSLFIYVETELGGKMRFKDYEALLLLKQEGELPENFVTFLDYLGGTSPQDRFRSLRKLLSLVEK